MSFPICVRLHGNESIWRKVQRGFGLSDVVAEAPVAQSVYPKKWKKTCLPKYSGCELRMNT